VIEEHQLPNGRRIRFDKENHTYDLDLGLLVDTGQTEWERVPSVTTILNIFHKPALVWWGMQMGARGIAETYQELQGQTNDGVLSPVEAALGNPDLDAAQDSLIALLTEHKRTVNHVTRSAADRGTSVHDDLQAYAQLGAEFEDKTGWHEAAHKFLSEQQPQFRRSEVIVGSWDNRWAGTPDALVYIGDDLWLIDYKTSKRVYETHYAQLAFYKEGLKECGYVSDREYTELRQGIVLLQPNGKYKLTENTHVDTGHVRDILAGYRGYQALKPPRKKK